MKLEHDILSLHPPQRRSLKYLKEVFGNRTPGDTAAREPMIRGEMGRHLDDEGDLSLVSPPLEQDRLTALLEGRLAWLVRGKTEDGKVSPYISHRKVEVIVTTITIALAAAFLVGAMIGLFYLEVHFWRLIVVMILVILFALSLGLLTNARRQDIFASTAAYAAVLVVIRNRFNPNTNVFNSCINYQLFNNRLGGIIHDFGV
ncbi:hypothetical protein OQA88_7758 [Cercophora sp. LCS_1]